MCVGEANQVGRGGGGRQARKGSRMEREDLPTTIREN